MQTIQTTRHLLFFPAFLLILFGALPAHAVVSMENLHLKTPAEGFEGEIDLSAGGSSGNTDKSDISVGTRLQWQTGMHTDYVVLNYAYGESNDVRDTNRSFLHVRHIGRISRPLAWELFLQGESNEFGRIEFRRLAGGGARFSLLEKQTRSDAFLGVGAFYEMQTITDIIGTTDTGTETTWRGNLYLVLKYVLNDNVRLVSSTYYQPSFEDSGDYRAIENAALEVSMTEKLALSVRIEVKHNSRPPQTVEKTDVIYRTGINYKF
jgi:putative salt-induced outer membrane protein YdiY